MNVALQVQASSAVSGNAESCPTDAQDGDAGPAFYDPLGDGAEELEIMRLLDEQYTASQLDGVPSAIGLATGYTVHRSRVARLMRRMGLDSLVAVDGLVQPVCAIVGSLDQGVQDAGQASVRYVVFYNAVRFHRA